MKKILRIAFVFSLALIMTNCADGEDGINGNDGINGENAIGYDELVKYGSVVSKIEGTTNDDRSFTDETDYKYTSKYYFDDDEPSNDVEYNGDDATFIIRRFIANPDDSYQEDYVYLELEVSDLGLSTQSFYLYAEIEGHPILLDDKTFFEFETYFESDDSGITNFTIDNFTFDKATNKLNFNYSANQDANDNDTGNSVTISGVVDVVVFEQIVDPK